MKKLVSIILFITLFVVPALADEIDLSSMTFDELLTLRAALNSEISMRLENESSNIYSGKYIVGEDIKAGTYVLFADMPSAYYVSIQISWPDKSHEVVFEQIKINETYYLDLKEGCVLYLDGIQLAHLNAVAIPEWAP